MKTMKLSVMLFLAASTVMVSCKKKGCMDAAAVNYDEKAKKDDGSCNYKPVITVNGDNPATIAVGGTYTDAGASAVANGVAVNVVTDASAVNTTTAGNYEVKYTATNDHGTANATRVVKVELLQSSYVGTYTRTTDCSGTQFPLADNVSVVAGSTSSKMLIQSAFSLIGGEIVLDINGKDITVNNQTVSSALGDIQFSGSGTMNNTATQMVINFNYVNAIPLLGGSGTCSATYTKQ